MSNSWKMVNVCPRCANTHRCPIDCTVADSTKNKHNPNDHRILEPTVWRDCDCKCAACERARGN